MATEKQVWFVEKLMAERDIQTVYDTVEAKMVLVGMGYEIPNRQMSRFIDELIALPKKATIIQRR